MYNLRKIEFYSSNGYAIKIKDVGYVSHLENDKYFIYFYECLDDIYSIFLDYTAKFEGRVSIVNTSIQDIALDGHKYFRLKYIDSDEFLGEY